MNIFLQPAGERATKQLQITIYQKEDLNKLKEYVTKEEYENLSQLYPTGKVNMWGVTLKREKVWKQINNHDLILFYGGGKFFVKGQVKYTLHNKELADHIWGCDEEGLTWEYIFFLEDAQKINIPIEEFNQKTGYQFEHVQGAMRVSKPGAAENLLQSYQDIFNLNYEEIQNKEEKTKIQKLEDKILNLSLENINNNCKIVNYVPNRKRNKDQNTSKSKRRRTKEKNSNLTEGISDVAKCHLGLLGELYIYKLLKEKKLDLLKNLNLCHKKFEIICYNKDYQNQKDWEDKSSYKGHDILIKVEENEEIYLEVKTSIEDTNYYSMTGNELAVSKVKRKNYYIIKITNFSNDNSSSKNSELKISTIRDPYKLVEEGNQIKDISIYC